MSSYTVDDLVRVDRTRVVRACVYVNTAVLVRLWNGRTARRKRNSVLIKHAAAVVVYYTYYT